MAAGGRRGRRAGGPPDCGAEDDGLRGTFCQDAVAGVSSPSQRFRFRGAPQGQPASRLVPGGGTATIPGYIATAAALEKYAPDARQHRAAILARSVPVVTLELQ